MKRHLLVILKTFLLAISLFSTQAIAQNEVRTAYYDALTISKLYENNSATGVPLDNETWRILKFYFPSKASLPTDILNNPFLKTYFNAGGSSSVLDKSVIQEGLGVSSVGADGLSITTVADGLAKFLVKRTKEELTVAFFDRFKEVFVKFPELQIVFPNTIRTFGVIDSFNFSAYLNTIRQAFLKDLDNLHINIPNLEGLKNVNCLAADANCRARIGFYSSFFTSDNGYLLKTALSLVEELKRGTNPAEIITMLSQSSDLNKIGNPNFREVKSVLDLTAFISNNLLSTDENKIWISGNEIRNLISDPTTLKIYLGLLYQSDESSKIVFQTAAGVPQSLRQLLGGLASNLLPIESYLKSMAFELDKVNSAVSNIRALKISGGKPDNSDYFTFYSSIVSFLSNASKLNLLGITISHQKEIDEFMRLASSAGNTYHNLSSRNYSAAVADLRVFLEDVGVTNGAFLKEFLKYGSFMATVAEAENSDQVQAAIEAVALPAGSATIKKRTEQNIALNAYVGLSPGLEYYGETDAYGFSLGVNAPIGVAFSKGRFDYEASTNTYAEKGSTTWYFTLIDLGAVTSFRFGDSETEKLPEIKLENIFAPGVYHVWGLAKWPVSIGLGGQLGPQLRGITDVSTDVDSNLSFSVKAFVAVDIPLLNFYTRSR
ncbi:hypothetical protein [Flagellimonas sp.]|uniref:hypothetical protein n=1 Tax=Flagellimonas sp. TaxID=2058762 RepID=UPI003B5C3E89